MALFGVVVVLEEFLATSEFGEFVGDETAASEATVGELWPFLLMPTSDMATRISSFLPVKILVLAR